MPVQGLVRLRKHQFGRQGIFGTKVAATRAYPFSGVPGVDLTWTDQEVDAGSLDVTAAPFRGPGDYTAPLTDPAIAYDDLPLMLSAAFGGEVEPVPSVTAQTWTFEPVSVTVDPIDVATYEFGDDVLTDWYQLGDGLLETLEIAGPEGLGPLTASMSWRFGSASSKSSTDSPVTGTVPTPGLAVDTSPIPVYLKDGGIFIASVYGDLATSQISDALHSFVLRVTKTIDQKRFANADNSFDVDAWAIATRAIELECTFAKTIDTVGTGSETDAWFSDTAVTRYVRMEFTSLAEAEYGVPYSWFFEGPMRYYTRTEGEVGGNAVIVLTGHFFYEPAVFAGVFKSEVVNILTGAELGIAGS